MIFSNQTSSNDFNVVFYYPSDQLMLEKHTKILTYLTNSEFDQRLKYYFDQVKKIYFIYLFLNKIKNFKTYSEFKK